MTQSFGPFTFDPDRRSLTRGGQSTELGQRASALLAALLAAGGHPVSKATLMDAVWPDTTVEEGNLTVQISGLRKALGPGPGGAEYIVTVPRIGYRLVQEAVLADAELPLRPALAVMPFANLSGDVGQDYFADGVVEDIIIALSKFRSFAVIARNSTFAYRGRSPGVPQVATELGVLYVVEGSVRRRGDHIRITAQLVDGKNGSNLWAQNFDGATADIFDVQDQITVVSRSWWKFEGGVISG
jgi:TolB-like protein